MVTKIMNNVFAEVEESDFALVDFSAVWCGPCNMLAPVLDELSEEMKDKLTFWNVDVDANGELAMKFGITNIPTLILFKKGKAVDMQVGFLPKAKLKTWIESQM